MLQVLEYSPDLTLSSQPGNASRGTATCKKIYGNPEQYSPVCEVVADLAMEFDKIRLLLESHKENDTTRTFVAAVIRKVLEKDNAWKHISSEQLVSNFGRFEEMLGKETDALQELVAHLVRDSNLSGELVEREFEPAKSRLYILVSRAERPAEEARIFRDFLLRGLRGVATEEWATALAHGGPLLDLLVMLVHQGEQIGLKNQLEDAMLGHADGLLDGSSEADVLADRIDDVLAALAPAYRKGLPKRIMDKASTDRPLKALLSVYGHLLVDKTLVQDAGERLVFHAFKGILDRLDPTELRWLLTIVSENPTLISDVSEPATQGFHDRLQTAYERQGGEETVPALLRDIAEQTGVSIESEREDQKDQNETGRQDSSASANESHDNRRQGS